jgi:hypothetical protein
MARSKIDGVIEAVRYIAGGIITVARTYERRGAVWSDHILLERKDLVEQLKKGKHFVTGARKMYLGSEFKTGPAIHYIDDHILTDGQTATRDLLVGVTIF